MSSENSKLACPPIAYETHFWKPKFPDYYSAAELKRQTGEYESALPASIAGWHPAMSSDLVADVESATLSLREFDLYTLTKFDPHYPALAPMSSILLRTESASSSQIEQLTTSAKQLALAELGENEKVNAQTVVGNVRAMEAALRLSDNIGTSSILEMHRELLSRQLGMEEHAGQFRHELVWIGGKDNAGPRGADFIASQPEQIAAAMNDLVTFIQRVDLPALAQVAIAHAQFETIHPFVDGNGRTGRALAQSMLRNKELATRTTIPLSAGILRDTESYFSALTAYRHGDAHPIIRTFADAARFAAASGRALVDDLSAQLENARKRLDGVRPQSMAWKALPILIAQPILNMNYLRRALGINNASATRTLDTLTDRGILVERTGKARNRVWEHQGILDVLDEYARMIKRATSPTN